MAEFIDITITSVSEDTQLEMFVTDDHGNEVPIDTFLVDFTEFAGATERVIRIQHNDVEVL